MQEAADDIANKLRRSKLARESNKDLLPIFTVNANKDKNKSIPQTLKKDYLHILDDEEKEGRNNELETLLDQAESQRVNLNQHRSMLEIAEMIAPSRENNPRELYPIYYKNSVGYVRDVLRGFLEEDVVIEPNQAYFIPGEYPPVIKSRLLNMRQSNFRDAKNQLNERPKDMLKTNSPVLARPLKSQFLKTHN